jgi:hypothetical protein
MKNKYVDKLFFLVKNETDVLNLLKTIKSLMINDPQAKESNNE